MTFELLAYSCSSIPCWRTKPVILSRSWNSQCLLKRNYALRLRKFTVKTCSISLEPKDYCLPLFLGAARRNRSIWWQEWGRRSGWGPVHNKSVKQTFVTVLYHFILMEAGLQNRKQRDYLNASWTFQPSRIYLFLCSQEKYLRGLFWPLWTDAFPCKVIVK